VSTLEEKLRDVASAPVLLVASDYDGTLAPIVSDPAQAVPERESLVALRKLASLPHTSVAIISGRALKTLAELTGSLPSVHLVGSHGGEFDPGFASSLPGAAVELRDRIAAALEEIAAASPGFLIEKKPASIAFHYRNAADPDAHAALRRIVAGPASWPGVITHHGKRVIELAVIQANKGAALAMLRQRMGATATIFIGDDQTDESAFAAMSGPDVGVKVGPEHSRAAFRIQDTTEVARLLAHISELRAAWAAGAEAVPIEKHSLLSDQRTIALLSPDARLVWLCLPRIDSAAAFGEIVGGPAAGRFAITPENGSRATRQAYLGGSMVLRTEFPSFRITDFMDCSGGRVAQRAGRCDLIRILEGSGPVLIEFAPRIDFGRLATGLKVVEGGIQIENSPDPMVLRAPGVSWSIQAEGRHHTAIGRVELRPDAPLALELRYGIGSLRDTIASPDNRLRLTERFWSSWAEGLRLPAVKPDLVLRSALALKALVYGPTGAVCAAATTSLPEHIGGVRNWDYRFCWLRDAALSAAALVRLGSLSEAMAYLDWVLGVVDKTDSPERLRPLYTVNGHSLGPEAEIADLPGYRGSRPVRVGNSAAVQVQLDVFGPIADLVALLADQEAPLSADHVRLVEAMVSAVAVRWRDPDHGIWEIRKAPRHHVHSKAMCWVAVDRGVKIADRILGRPRPDWESLRSAIAADVLAHGYKPDLGAFTAAYDGADLDAATLIIGLCGLLPPDDPRFAGTVRAVEAKLRHGPTVYRYRADDGLPGTEGGFHLCTSWLIDAYWLSGRRDEARALFEDLCHLAGPTGLLSEQFQPGPNIAVGNHPQAYSHLALIDNAVRLSAG
jgi:trehalose-phosphatase